MIVFCGYANLDVVGWVPRMPGADERVHATAIQHLDGGMAANAAVAAARAGAPVAFAGAVGPDPLSTAFLERLAADGVDPGWTDRTAFLSTAVVLVDGEGRRAVVSEDDALGADHVGAVADRLEAAGGGLLYLDGYRAASVAGAVRPGVVLGVDLDGCTDAAAALTTIEHADHVVVGRHRLEVALGIAADRWAALAAEHRTSLAVTDGPRGWQLYRPREEPSSGPALAVDVVDDTGAGDCFAGTYLAGVDAGLPPAQAASRAAVAASLSCTVRGARGAPTPRQVDEALARSGPAVAPAR